MEFNFKDILTTSMVLFAVIDIIGNIPIIIDLRKKAGHIQSEKASLIAGFILIIFLFLGEQLLSIIGLDVHSFAIAGSLIIFFIALEMILGIKIYKEEKNPLNATVFPLAFPLIAGPGSLTTLLSLKAAFIDIVLKASTKIEKIIGENGIGIIRKVFGVILLAISIKLFTTNIKFLL
jgi:multiple antibiotic resistance protein